MKLSALFVLTFLFISVYHADAQYLSYQRYSFRSKYYADMEPISKKEFKRTLFENREARKHYEEFQKNKNISLGLAVLQSGLSVMALYKVFNFEERQGLVYLAGSTGVALVGIYFTDKASSSFHKALCTYNMSTPKTKAKLSLFKNRDQWVGITYNLSR
jgi:hypothetical protein